MFELINNRGIKLNPADHVKAYLLSMIEQNTDGDKITKRYDREWKGIVDNVTSYNGSNYKLDKFLNHYLLLNKYRPKTVPHLKLIPNGFKKLINSGMMPDTIIDELSSWSKVFEKI